MLWKFSIYYTGLHDHTDRQPFKFQNVDLYYKKRVKQTKIQKLKTKNKTNKKKKKQTNKQTKETQK